MAEPLNATFFAFRNRDRAVLLPASVTIVVIFALLIGAFVALNWGTFVSFPALIAQSTAAPPSDAVAAQWVGRIFGLVGGMFLLMIPLYIAAAAYEAACLRWMIHGEAPGLFGLTLGNDTWRVYGVYWCWLIGNWVIGFVISMVTLPIMFGVLGPEMASGDSSAMMMAQLKVQLPITLIQYAVLIFVGVRFAPAAATSVALRRFSFFTAWTVTRDRFWSLLGAFAVIWIGALVIGVTIFVVVMSQVIGPVVSAGFSGWPNVDAEAVMAAYAGVFTPRALMLLLASYALSIPVSVLFFLMGFGVNARAAQAALEEGKIAPATSAG